MDLHVHTTCSDGSYTPEEIVDLAKRSGLAALGITDHDTLDAITAARVAAAGSKLEIVPAVEVSTRHKDQELHILGYFVRPEDVPLRDWLVRLQRQRVQRFQEMIERLAVWAYRLRTTRTRLTSVRLFSVARTWQHF